MDLGKRIQKYRKLAGLTQKELAEKLGVVTGTVQQYELGKRHPRLDQFQRIANALGVKVHELYSDKQEYQEWLSQVLDNQSRVNERRVDKGYIEQLHDEDVTQVLDKGLDNLYQEYGVKHQDQSFANWADDEERQKYAKAFEMAYRVGILEGLKGVRPPNEETLVAAGLDEKYAGFIMQFKKHSLEEQKVLMAEMERVHRQKLETEEED